jgi:phage terminase large subunit-like protein
MNGTGSTVCGMPTVRDEKDYCAVARQYAEGVVNGTIAACEWVHLACQRQLNDLARESWQFRFDRGRANQVCAFIEKLPHGKGLWKTRTIVLEPWQCFFLTTIFGWVDADGLRRFRKALVVTPRKNSKTTLAASVGLYLLTMDQEPGPEVYSAATTRDQARICWDIAKLMVQRTPPLRNRYSVEPLAHSIAIEQEGAFFKPLSRDADSLEGLNVHGAIIDELHAHKTREVFDVLDDATGSRRQPLLFIISTEGDSSEGIFPEQVDYAQAVLSGRHEDDSYFAIIYTVDKEDDWTSPEVWRKANPNLGVSVFEKDLEIRAKQAIANADSQASFLTKRLNIRVGASSAYFNMLAWERLCKDPSLRIEDVQGQPSIITIDLASKRDLTAKIVVFTYGNDYYVFGKYYLPRDAIEPGRANYDFYRGWEQQGWLTLTEGNITDYDFLERDLLENVARFKPRQVGVDPNYNAGQFTTRMLAAGVPMVDVPHNVMNFSEPMKQLDALVVAGRIHHNGDPVLGWAMSNVVARKDAKDNVYPRKARDGNKIDPAVALIAKLSLQLRFAEEERSVYEDPRTAVM